MILLDSVNKLIENTVLERLRAEKPIAVEFKVADFDGGRFHIFTSEANKSELNISFTSVAADTMLKNGGTEELKKTVWGCFCVSRKWVRCNYPVHSRWNS